MKRFSEYGIILLLLAPLFFINIKNTHDWGDDFAQYLQQAKNITEEKSQNVTGYIFNESFFIGPKAYPAGFPLLLAPVINNAEPDIKILNLYMSLFWFLSCFTGFLILRRNLSLLSSVCITLIIAYNPQMVNFKTEVVSDYPYTFFSLLCLYLMHFRDKITITLITCVLLGFLAHIRSIGHVLWLVFIIHSLYLFCSKQRSAPQTIKTLSAGIAAMLAVYAGIRLFFPADTNYPGLFETHHLWDNWNKQLSYNADKLFMFFRWFNMDSYFYIGVFAGSCLLVFSILGLLQSVRQSAFSPINLYVIAYLGVILSFRLGDSGLRFMFPLLFLLFLYAAQGLKKTLLAFDLKHAWTGLSITLVILFSYTFELRTIIEKTNVPYEGPNKKEAQEVFQFISEKLPEQGIIHFDKPRALAFYTGRKSFASNPFEENYDLKKELKKFKASYLLTSNIISDARIHQTAAALPQEFKVIYKNDEFTLFELALI